VNLTLKHLKLERPLAVIDLETTGLDPADDRAVEVAALKLSPGAKPELFHELVHPGRKIPAGAAAVHGIDDRAVAGKPRFAALAGRLLRFLRGCDLAGFNLTAFDLPLLVAEFARAGQRFRLAGRSVVDVLHVYRRHEPRDLAAAVRHYLDRGHAGAHSAKADVRATAEVLDAQVGRYSSLPETPAGLHAAFVEVDIAGKFGHDAEGQIVFRFGKHKGRRLAEVATSDPGYLEWMLAPGRFLEDAQALVRSARAGETLDTAAHRAGGHADNAIKGS
jgi:DNA polymerase-3 subunit epsilon